MGVTNRFYVGKAWLWCPHLGERWEGEKPPCEDCQNEQSKRGRVVIRAIDQNGARVIVEPGDQDVQGSVVIRTKA